jgi:hypothetical protein
VKFVGLEKYTIVKQDLKFVLEVPYYFGYSTVCSRKYIEVCGKRSGINRKAGKSRSRLM